MRLCWHVAQLRRLQIRLRWKPLGELKMLGVRQQSSASSLPQVRFRASIPGTDGDTASAWARKLEPCISERGLGGLEEMGMCSKAELQSFCNPHHH